MPVAEHIWCDYWVKTQRPILCMQCVMHNYNPTYKLTLYNQKDNKLDYKTII